MTYDTPEPAYLSTHRDEHDPRTGEPKIRELVISDDLGHTLLVKLTSLGELSLRYVSTHALTTLHLSAELWQALLFASYDFVVEQEKWQEQQMHEQQLAAQGAPTDPTQDQEPLIDAAEGSKASEAASDDAETQKMFDDIWAAIRSSQTTEEFWDKMADIRQAQTEDEQATQAEPRAFEQPVAIMDQIVRYERAALFGDDLSETEYQALDDALSTSETMLEARRKAAEAVQQAEPRDELHCVCVGCQNPATVQIGEFWYCAEHRAEPIPF